MPDIFKQDIELFSTDSSENAADSATAGAGNPNQINQQK